MKADMKTPENWINRDIFASYCGDKPEKLLSFYDKAVEKKNMMSFSFNWCAFLLLPAWLGYRRQWTLLICISVILAALPFIEALTDYPIPGSSLFGVFVVFGFMANGFLLTNAHTEFKKLKQSGISDEQIRDSLSGKASPSLPLAFISTIAYLLIIMGSVFLADMLFGLPY